MARDALQLLLSIRQRSVDQAQQTLALYIKAETDIRDKINALNEAAQRDHLAARVSAERLPFLDMFVARLQQMQTERRSLDITLTAAEARSASAQATLASARKAAEAVETLLQERKTAAAVLREKQAQHVLDDIARTQRSWHQHNADQ